MITGKVIGLLVNSWNVPVKRNTNLCVLAPTVLQGPLSSVQLESVYFTSLSNFQCTFSWGSVGGGGGGGTCLIC